MIMLCILILHMFLIYMLPWFFLGLIVISVIWGLVSGIYERSLENYVRQHTGWRPDD